MPFSSHALIPTILPQVLTSKRSINNHCYRTPPPIASSCRRSNSPLSAAELFRLPLPPSGTRSLSASTLQSFQHHLKNFLFRRSFPDILLYWTFTSGPSSNDDYLGHSKNHDWLIDWLIDWLNATYMRVILLRHVNRLFARHTACFKRAD